MIQADAAASDLTWIRDEQVLCKAAVNKESSESSELLTITAALLRTSGASLRKHISYFSILAADGKILRW